MIKEQYKYSDLTAKIIGCAMTVHTELGNGFQEVIYQRALEIEMADQGIAFSREYEMPVYYKQQQIGKRRVDFLVEGIVAVELKAVIQLEDVHLAQAINYLEAYDLEIGLLINFGAKSLQFKRLSNKSFKQLNQGNPKIGQNQNHQINQKNHIADQLVKQKNSKWQRVIK